ncbi:MAG: hypothetical protein M3N54_00175, partial [Acidobacteriota bacterium]|nr:hypothetical protein [Acidobacteriota bacterium]
MSRHRARARISLWLPVCIAVLVGGSFIPLAWKVRLGAHGPYHLKVHFAAFALCGFVAYASTRAFAARAWRGLSLVLMAFDLETMEWRFFG